MLFSFPGIKASTPCSCVLGRDFFIPFPCPNFEWIYFVAFSFQNFLEMKLYIPIPAPELIKVIPARPWFIGLNKTSAIQRKQSSSAAHRGRLCVRKLGKCWLSTLRPKQNPARKKDENESILENENEQQTGTTPALQSVCPHLEVR